MSIDKNKMLDLLNKKLLQTAAYDLVFLYNTEFSKLENYKLIKYEDEAITLTKTNKLITKDLLVEHMIETIKILNRNHFVAAIFNLISIDVKYKYDYQKDLFIQT